MYIYSGKYRLGKCGDPTTMSDYTGAKLFVGDIVITSTIDKDGICNNNGLTVVASEKYTSYQDGHHVEKDGEVEYFIMGIKGVDFMGKDADTWSVKKLKSWEDVVDGEHWKDFGFNYSSK